MKKISERLLRRFLFLAMAVTLLVPSVVRAIVISGGFRPNTSVLFLSDVSEVSAGYTHSCAVLNTGRVKCWGENGYGELGDGTTTNSLTPVSVSGISNAESVMTGILHSCAILDTGEMKCWGINDYGQLGDGTNTDSSVPVSVSVIDTTTSTITNGDIGRSHSCVVLDSGEIKCWGRNESGQLGDGTTTNTCDPTYEDSSGNSCDSAIIDCDRTTTTSCIEPVAVSGITVESVSVGDDNACAVLSTGLAKCWGDNIAGQLGNGTTTDSSTPVFVRR